MRLLLNQAEFHRLIEDASVLEEIEAGIKVYLLRDRRVLKLFRIKRIFSSSLLYPYSFRFARNARRLAALGIPSVEVERIFYCHSIRQHGVIYPLLEGTPYSRLLDESHSPELLQKLADFIVRLHSLGIYFRSLHPGNILLLEDGRLGLIDIGDMRFRNRSLNRYERVRNFHHLYRSADHGHSLRAFGYQAFVNLYLQALQRQARPFPGLERQLLAAKPIADEISPRENRS